MNFLFPLIVFLVSDVLVLVYLVNSEFFSPETLTGEKDLWNIFVFIVLVVLAVGMAVSLVVFLAEKILYCGKREFPSPRRAIKYGAVVAIILFVIVTLHIFHILNFFVALILVALAVIGIILIR